jgi:hypothetical protein
VYYSLFVRQCLLSKAWGRVRDRSWIFVFFAGCYEPAGHSIIILHTFKVTWHGLEGLFDQYAFSGMAHNHLAERSADFFHSQAKMRAPIKATSSQAVANGAFAIVIMRPLCLETLGTAAIGMMLSSLPSAVGAGAHERMVAVQRSAYVTNTTCIVPAAVFDFKDIIAPAAAGIIYGRPDGLLGLLVAGFFKENRVVFPGAIFAEGVTGVFGVQTARGCRHMQASHQASVTPPAVHFALSSGAKNAKPMPLT